MKLTQGDYWDFVCSTGRKHTIESYFYCYHVVLMFLVLLISVVTLLLPFSDPVGAYFVLNIQMDGFIYVKLC